MHIFIVLFFIIYGVCFMVRRAPGRECALSTNARRPTVFAVSEPFLIVRGYVVVSLAWQLKLADSVRCEDSIKS